MIKFEEGLLGTKATITGEWKDIFLEQFLSKNIKELELNDGKGWRGKNIDFLKFLPQLESLIIIDLPLKEVAPVHHLVNLRKLTLITYSKTAINFDCFPNILECEFEWITGSDSLFNRTTLQKLFINRYKEKSDSRFSNLKNLKELSILNSPINSLESVFTLKNLRFLRIANLPFVESLNGIQDLEKLEELMIQLCKNINSISETYSLPNLTKLMFLDSGNLDSIKGIEKLGTLTEFFFYGTTNVIDGDLSPLTKLKNLEKISFQNRRHYSHKREEFFKLKG